VHRPRYVRISSVTATKKHDVLPYEFDCDLESSDSTAGGSTGGVSSSLALHYIVQGNSLLESVTVIEIETK